MYGYFMQANDMVHTANFSMSVPEDVISRWLITDRLWPPTSADLNV
jgi:hypothetical protein